MNRPPLNTIRTMASKPWRATLLGRPFTPWHVVWAGTMSFGGNAWLFSTVVFGWHSERLPNPGSALFFPMCFVIGLTVFAFAVVALRRDRDWRLAVAALFGFLGVVLFVVSFLTAAGRPEK
jgi:drug/metabolite transporter (DMT)-like permease